MTRCTTFSNRRLVVLHLNKLSGRHRLGGVASIDHRPGRDPQEDIRPKRRCPGRDELLAGGNDNREPAESRGVDGEGK